MLTLFTIPRAFEGLSEIHQTNAIRSWKHLEPEPEVILFCDDLGVGEAARLHGCLHVPGVQRSRFGIPLVGDAFRIASLQAHFGLLCYANADIIFLQDFVSALCYVEAAFPGPFLMVGQHWDLGLDEPLEFSKGWSERLRARVETEGQIERPCGLDYFAYRRSSLEGIEFPAFQVGSPAWDNWLAGKSERAGVPIIDATRGVKCIHQRHTRRWPADGTVYNRGLWAREGGIPGCTSSAQWSVDSYGIYEGKGPRTSVQGGIVMPCCSDQPRQSQDREGQAEAQYRPPSPPLVNKDEEKPRSRPGHPILGRRSKIR